MLRAEIGVVEALGFLEHVLPEDSGAATGRCDGAHVVDSASLCRLGELHHVPGAAYVGRFQAARVGSHVVERGQVEHVVDAAAQFREPAGIDAQQGTLEIAHDGDDALRAAVPAPAERLQPGERRPAHQRVDGAASGEQELHQVAPDEAGRSGEEVVHGSPLRILPGGFHVGRST